MTDGAVTDGAVTGGTVAVDDVVGDDVATVGATVMWSPVVEGPLVELPSSTPLVIGDVVSRALAAVMPAPASAAAPTTTAAAMERLRVGRTGDLRGVGVSVGGDTPPEPVRLGRRPISPR